MYRGTKTASRSWARFREIAAHVSKHASRLAALRSLAGFYYQDLRTSNVTGLERLVLAAMQFYSRHKRRLKKSIIDEKNSYGFSRSGNNVIGEADVFLPWYKQSPPVGVRIRCGLATAPEVQLNGVSLVCQPGTAFIFDMPPPSCLTPLLNLKLKCQREETWQLNGVQIF
jgi:hypothetical protein